MVARKISSYRPPLMGITHMVSANNYHAAIAGYRILEEGGNAVDAGVATGIAINVTQPHHTGFGGVAPIILYNAKQEQVLTISGLGTWPRAASIEFFKEKYAGDLPVGILRSVVPAAADAWLTAIERFGTMTFAQVVAPSIRLAEEGFPTEEQLHSDLKEAAPLFSQWPSSRQALMPKGYIPHVGEIFQRPELTNTFKHLVEV